MGEARSLRRVEAVERAAQVAVERYEVHIDLTLGPEVFGSTTRILFRAAQPEAGTFVELRGGLVQCAQLNGVDALATARVANRIELTGLLDRNELVVRAELPYSRSGEGMHRFVDPIDNETYVGAYVGVDYAQRVFACFDQPDLKAPIVTTVTAPPDWTVVANGTVASRQDGEWSFAETPPLSPYLFALVAGPLHSVSTEHSGLAFVLHSRRSLAEHLDREADEILRVTTACFDHYSGLFAQPYPFGTYEQAFVPELNWGAMESPGCVTFRDEFVFRGEVTEVERERRGMVIAHEMAHMWFGNLVTMRWWDDLWLSESFAEYMGFRVLAACTDFTETWVSFGISEKVAAYDADQRSSTHPVAAPPGQVSDTVVALANFDRISYAKGASALRQLVEWIGEEAFAVGLNGLLTEHAFGIASLTDLIRHLSAASGLPVDAWADAWLRTTGVDELTVKRTGDEVDIRHPGVRTHRLAVGGWSVGGTAAEAREQRRLTLPAGETSERLRVDGPAVLLNDGDRTYAKVRYDPATWSALADSLSDLPRAGSRMVVWVTARDLVRDGQMPVQDWLELVTRHLPSERHASLAAGVLSFTRRVVADRYAGAARGGALACVAEACRALLDADDPQVTPGLRLLAVRALIESASAVEAEQVAGWLAGASLPAGVELDSDLRWRGVLRLCALGQAGQAEISAAQTADTVGTALSQALRCRASLPDPSVKEETWQRILHDDSLSTQLAAASAEGFWQVEQADLLADWTPRYFSESVVLARRGSAAATVAGRSLFPWHAVDPATRELGRSLLRSGDVPRAMERELADQLDDLDRALSVRGT